MKRIWLAACSLLLLSSFALSQLSYASGSPYRFYGYALAGANPRAVFIVVDSNGNGVKGVPISVTCTTGTLDVVAGNTAADGTLTVQQSGAALGSNIEATCASVSVGSPATIITSDSVDRVNNLTTDPTYFWFDESRRLLNMVSVTGGKGVLTLPATSSFRFYPEDKTTNGRTITTSQDWNVAVQQGTTGPIQVEVYQGTFQNGDDVRLYDSRWGRWLDVNGNGLGEVVFSPTPPAYYLNAYAVDGASPTVCAVVTDTNGVGVSGVVVNVTATAGTFPLTSDVTGDGGRVFFYQQGGTLGNTITVTCSALTETSPVTIKTSFSPAIQATDKVFSWFSRKTRRIFAAVVNRQTNVLVTSVLAPTQWPTNYFTNGADANQRPAETTGTGVWVDQTSQQPAMAAVPHGATVSGDLFYVANIPALGVLYHYGSCQFAITLPANETQYLLAFASGGANPTIWAAVTGPDGNAVKGVTVNFSLQGTGALATASGPTSWNGMLTNSLTGAGAVGNTITVTSAGLGTITIVTSDSLAVETSDRVYGWYDPDTHKIIGSVVTFATNVMTVAGTAVGGSAVKRTGGLQTPCLGYSLANEQNTPQSATQPFIGHAGFGTIASGDFIRITQNGTRNTYDTHIIATADPAKFLVAFAEGGVNPRVWAVVMDNHGNGLENEPVTFSALDAGTLSLGSVVDTSITTVTGYGGFVRASHTSGVAGNTITVSAPGLSPVTIYTTVSAPASGSHNDNGVAWYDDRRMTIWGISFDEANHVILASQSWYDWGGYSPAGPYVTYTSGALKVNKAQAYDMNSVTRKINPLAQWSIAYGTANAGDECWVDLALIKSYIHFNTVRSSYLRACANPGVNPSRVWAVMVDAHGVGIPNVPVTFSASAGSMGGPTWTTGLDGSVYTSQTGGGLGDVLTVSSSGYPDVQIQTSNSGIIANNSPSVFWYEPSSRRLNSLMVQQPWHNVIVTSQANILFSASDQTTNNKTLAISGPKEEFAQSPTYGFVVPGSSGLGDRIIVQNNSVWGINDGLVTLPAEQARYLWAFASSGIDPKVWAAVTDANGNGVSGAPVHITYPGPVTVNLITDAAGVTTNTRSGIGLGSSITIATDGIANTITVKSANAQNVTDSTRAIAWYGVVDRMARAAFVNVPENVLALGTNSAMTAMDRTPNARTFSLQIPSVQQTSDYPAYVTANAGSEGEGDQIWIAESNTGADPDAILTLSVPTSEIVSTLSVLPTQVSIGQNVYVTMSVFNNGSPDALSVSPTALAVTGDATRTSGPTPGAWGTIPGGESRDFNWTYQVIGGSSNISFNGNAFGVDSFTMSGVTSTATNSNAVTVQTPVNLNCTFTAAQYAEINRTFDMTLTVSNAGQATALIANPINLTWTATNAASVSVIGNTSPATATIPGGGSQDFTWTVTTGPGIGTLQFNAAAQAIDMNSGNTITAIAVDSNTVNVIQGLLNLVRTYSEDTQVYRGQKNLAITMEVQNTSVTPITITASALDFNGSQIGFTVNHDPTNPLIAPAQSNFILRYIVDIQKEAPLGNVVIDGSIIWSGEGQNLSADGCAAKAAWTILEAYNSLRQNYPNPLRLSEQEYTTFIYFVREDVDVSIKMYNLAGELVAKLYEGRPGVGQHEIRWYGDNGNPNERGKTVGSGVYIAVFKIGDYQEMKKVVVIR